MKICLSDTRFNCVVVIVFAVLTCVGLINHEMWRDELQAWLIASDSESLAGLFKNIRYECHPALWHLILYLISRFTENPFYMQILHSLLAVLNVFIFTKYSTFSRLHKFLFAFGYYQLFEYNLICRNYSLGILFAFIFCVLYKSRPNNYLLMSLVLFLLANTSVYGLIIALSLGLLLFYDDFKNKEYGKKNILPLSILLAGVILSVYQMIPPPDFAIDFSPRSDAVTSLGALWRGVIPLRFPQYNFWTGLTNIFDALSIYLTAVFSLVLICIFYKVFKQDRKVFMSFFFGTYIMLVFTFMINYGSPRHHGHYYILFIVFLWLLNQNIKTNKIIYNVVTVIISLNFLAGMYSYYMDYKYPFTEAKNVAEYINSYDMLEMNLFGDKDYATVPVSAYLNKKINTIPSNNNRFTVWNKSRINPNCLTENEIADILVNSQKDVLVILNYKLSETHKLSFVKSFEKSIVRTEKYYLYLYNKDEI